MIEEINLKDYKNIIQKIKEGMMIPHDINPPEINIMSGEHWMSMSTWFEWVETKPKLHHISQDNDAKNVESIGFKNLLFIITPVIDVISRQEIEINKINTTGKTHKDYELIIGDSRKTCVGFARFAINEGFESLDDLIKHYPNGVKGTLIHWTNWSY